MSFLSALRGLFRPVFRPLPIEAPEGIFMRLSFALLANAMLFGVAFHFDSQPQPTGLAHYVDLTFLARPQVMLGLKVAFGLFSLGYIFGHVLALVLPLMTLIHVVVFTFNNSQGFTHHGNQIVSLILLAQSLVALFFLAHRRIKHRPFPLRSGKSRDSYLIYYSQVVIAGVYLTSVVSKMDESKFQWLQNLPNISVQLVKTHRQEYYSNPLTAKVAPSAQVPAATWMSEHPIACRALLGCGLLLEALMFLSLANRGWALVLGLALIAMHQSIAWLMRLYFDLNVWAALIFLINLPFWVIWCWRHHRDARDAAPALPRSERLRF